MCMQEQNIWMPLTKESLELVPAGAAEREIASNCDHTALAYEWRSR